jgi:hypothetical protein
VEERDLQQRRDEPRSTRQGKGEERVIGIDIAF